MSEYVPTLCPACGNCDIPTGYGLPGPELLAAAGLGEVRLGGCVLPDRRLGLLRRSLCDNPLSSSLRSSAPGVDILLRALNGNAELSGLLPADGLGRP